MTAMEVDISNILRDIPDYLTVPPQKVESSQCDTNKTENTANNKRKRRALYTPSEDFVFHNSDSFSAAEPESSKSETISPRAKGEYFNHHAFIPDESPGVPMQSSSPKKLSVKGKLQIKSKKTKPKNLNTKNISSPPDVSSPTTELKKIKIARPVVVSPIVSLNKIKITPPDIVSPTNLSIKIESPCADKTKMIPLDKNSPINQSKKIKTISSDNVSSTNLSKKIESPYADKTKKIPLDKNSPTNQSKKIKTISSDNVSCTNLSKKIKTIPQDNISSTNLSNKIESPLAVKTKNIPPDKNSPTNKSKKIKTTGADIKLTDWLHILPDGKPNIPSHYMDDDIIDIPSINSSLILFV